jgi:hypothetical protein
MTVPHANLSARSLAVLEMISAGSSYEQILAAYPDFTYLDIFRAAEEALTMALAAPAPPAPPKWSLPARPASHNVVGKRERYPRAYESWSDVEDGELLTFLRAGATVAQIAGRLQRNRGAVRARIMKLNLAGELTPKERERLKRIFNWGGGGASDE